jgi:hypothetical protein
MSSGSSDEEPDEPDEHVELAGGKRRACPIAILSALTGGSRALARQHLFRITRRYGLELQRVRGARGGRPRAVCDFATAAKLVFLARCSASTETRLRYVASLASEMGEAAHDEPDSVQSLRDAHSEHLAAMRHAHDALRARVDRIESELALLALELRPYP